MNCIIVDDEKTSRRIIEQYILQTDFLTLIKSCSSAIEAANVLRNEKIHLIFLDIEMPEMNGLEFMKTLEQKPQVILVTSFEKYAVEAFEYDVTDYILKPISCARFLRTVSKAKKIFETQQPNSPNVSYIFVKSESQLVKINTKEILCIEALADYVEIYTLKNKFIVHSTMKGIEKKLPANDFMRVHRSFIIRLDKIESIDENTVIIKDKLIPIGGSYRKKLMEQINLV